MLSNTQSPSSPALVVTAMNSYAIDATNPPTFNASTGYVTFTTTVSPGFIAGSEFTVTGVSPSGYNHTYVAVAGTTGTTLVGNPLSGPVGVPQAHQQSRRLRVGRWARLGHPSWHAGVGSLLQPDFG